MSNKGLSLLEIIVSLLLMSLVLAGMANLFVAGKTYVAHSRAKMSGGELGKVFLDPLQRDVQALGAGTCLGGTPAVCPGSKLVGTITYTPNYVITDVGNLRKVKLTVQWPTQ